MRRDTVFNSVLLVVVPSPEDMEHVSPNKEISKGERRRRERVRVRASLSFKG
jgi:hypothetical protein